MRILLVIFFVFSIQNISAQDRDSISGARKARALVRQGNELFQTEQFTDASVAYKKALEQNPSYAKAAYNLGGALYQAENYE
jgi:tetratricopeptide (TPR) repeat protein